jgi:hypothetical protein
MNHESELKLLQEIEVLKKKIQILENKTAIQLPIYQYSKILDTDLHNLFNIEQILEQKKFTLWFNTSINIESSAIDFLNELLNDNKLLIERYSEEDLKINFIAPLLHKVQFKSLAKKIRIFYELPITYATNKFIFKGNADCVIAEGLIESKKPYFFIQEFKRGEKYGNPRPQLIAELISAIELNNWTTIKGAYVTGANWHFVILDKLQTDTYQYTVSQNFDTTKIDDLLGVYQHLMQVKHEIFTMLDHSKINDLHY